MVLDKKEVTVLYRCPECGSEVRSIIGIFSLTADMIRLKCPCGESQLQMIYTKDKKIKITVPCFFCHETHSFTLSAQAFFERDVFVYPCPYSGLDICFIGKDDMISDAVDKSNEAIQKMVEDMGLDDFDEKMSSISNSKIDESDSSIRDEAFYLLSEFADEGAIVCHCEDGGDYFTEEYDDHITLKCSKCGDSIDISTLSESEIKKFLNMDEIVLQPEE